MKPCTDRMQQLINQNVVLAELSLANAQELKQLYVPVPPDPPDETVIVVTNAQQLTEALATVTGPAEIHLAAGTYAGNFVLRKRSDTGIVTIRAEADIPEPGDVPWIKPEQTANFPELVVADPGLPVIRCEDGAADWALVGLEIAGNPARPDMTLLELGRGDITEAVQAPTRLLVERCYIHGDVEKGCRRGVSLQSSFTEIRSCYISQCLYSGQDAQAIAVWTSPGHFIIENNYLEGSGENLIIGGADPKVPDLVPTQIVIRGNYIYKPQAWRSVGGSVKNLLELKNARQVLIENNVLEGCWVDGQPGHAVVFTVRNQDGYAPWSTVADVTVRWNVVADTDGCFVNLLGMDDIHSSVRGSNIRIEQNLFYDGGGGVQSLSGYDQTTVQHNAFTGPYWKWLQFGGEPSGHFVWLDNGVPPTEYGITGDNTGIGKPSLDHYAPGAEMRCNSIGYRTWITYPDGNYLLEQGTPPAEYLAQASSDGGTVGVDVAELQRRIPWYHVPAVSRTWKVRQESQKKPVHFGMR